MLFSGGQDSTNCLAGRLRSLSESKLHRFSYGQRHGGARLPANLLAEICNRFPAWKKRLGKIRVLGAWRHFQLSGRQAMTPDIPFRWAESGLPNTSFQAGTCFFTAAADGLPPGGFARSSAECVRLIFRLSDCRDDTSNALQVALGRHGSTFRLETRSCGSDSRDFCLAEELSAGKAADIFVEPHHT